MELNKISVVELKQIPILTQKVEEVSVQLKKRIADLELDKLVATEQSRKSLKETRASLNKEIKEIHSGVLEIETKIHKPFTEFKNKYKELIQNPYKEADALLKTKIFTVEDKMKSKKAEVLKVHFTELVQSKNIDFLKFEDLNLSITLSASENKLKQQVFDFVDVIDKDLQLIKSYPESEDFKNEVLLEYQKNRNLSEAVSTVQHRVSEKERLRKIQEEKVEQQQVIEEQPKQTVEQPKVEVKTEVLQAPKVEVKEEVFEAIFKVKGTMKQLKSLKQFLTNNNIEIIK